MKKVVPPGKKSKFIGMYQNRSVSYSDTTPQKRILGSIEPHIKCNVNDEFIDSEGRRHNPKNNIQWIPTRDTGREEVGNCGIQGDSR